MVAVLTPDVRRNIATLSYRAPKTDDSWTM
uniref:Uncharacterized protein n=1 Tax=Arundo donax TaxID=35708 RepID=A0A0A9BPN1_ARUDO